MKIVLLHLVGTSYFPYTKILSNFRIFSIDSLMFRLISSTMQLLLSTINSYGLRT